MKPTVAIVQPASDDSAPYTLVQVDSPQSPAAIPLLTVTWNDVNFSAKTKDPVSGHLVDKQILSGVSGEALPGELLVLMGPSGAGKSTLLDCIANRNAACTGTVQVSGSPWTTALTKRACYVLQDDMFYANLTVQEHLLLQAELRMGTSVPHSERETRVAEIVSELGLTTVTHSYIGDVHVKGLSGGQRKRLSLATELLTNPSILFVDEPTSGLDSFMAETVVRQMLALARKGRTIIATIHQPTSTVFMLFDKLHLLVDGRTAYRGRASECVNHFADQGFHCPSFMNPADYFMQQLVVLDGDTDAPSRVKSLSDAWARVESTIAPTFVPLLDASIFETSSRSHRNDLSTQLRVLCRRNLVRLLRDAVAFRARMMSTVVMAVVCGLVFLQLTVSQTGIQDFTGVLFFLSVSQFMFSANPEFISVPLEIPLVLREHNGGLYHVLSWYLAKNVSELPFQLVYPMLFLIPSYYLVGFQNDAEMFFTFYLFIALVASTATGSGYMVSCLVKRVELAPTVGILLLLPFLLFGGLFINSDSTPVYFVWLQQISPIKYCFHGLMRAFWTKVPVISCPPGTGACRLGSGDAVLASNHIRTDRLVVDCLILLSINFCFRAVGALLLWRRAAKRNL